MMYRYINPGRVLYAAAGNRRKNHIYRPRRIRYDMYTVYCNRKTATYSLYALGTSIPRQSEYFNEIVKILHTLVKYKRDKLPGAFGEV